MYIHMSLEIQNIYVYRCPSISIYTCFCFCLASVRKIFTIVPVSEHRHFLQCVKLWSTYTYVYMHVRHIDICTYIYIYICIYTLARVCTHQVLIERFALAPPKCWTFTLFRCQNRASQWARERLFISEAIALTMTRRFRSVQQAIPYPGQLAPMLLQSHM